MPRAKITSSQPDKGQDKGQDSSDPEGEKAESLSSEARALIQALQHPDVIKAFVAVLEPKLENIVDKFMTESLALVNSKIEVLQTDFNNRIGEIQAKTESLTIDLQTTTGPISTKVDKLQKSQDEIQAKLHSLDRASKSCNLRIHGVQLKAQEGLSTQENLVDSIMEVIKEAGVIGVKNTDFENITRITPAGQQMFLLAKMTSPNLKKKLYTQRTKFRRCTSRIFINEDLTKSDSIIFKKARAQVKQGVLHSCWSTDGLIFGKSSPEGKPFQIKEL
jgi:hypothetical protein